jgi:hypothetical protein
MSAIQLLMNGEADRVTDKGVARHSSQWVAVIRFEDVIYLPILKR